MIIGILEQRKHVELNGNNTVFKSEEKHIQPQTKDEKFSIKFVE